MEKRNRGTRCLLFIEIAVLAVVLVVVFAGAAVKPAGKKNVNRPKDGKKTETVEENTDSMEESPVEFSEEVEEKLASMSMEEKVAQMFLITPEMLMEMDQVTVAGKKTQDAINAYPVGGLVYASGNFLGQAQTAQMLGGTQGYSTERIGLPMFLTVEEEGGAAYSPLASVNRYPVQKSAAEIGSPEEAGNTAAAIAEYLSKEGFNMNLAPYANAEGEEGRAFSGDAQIKEMVEAEKESYGQAGILPVIKYFPYDVSGMNLEKACAMIGNVVNEELTGDGETPCSMSSEAVETLREEVGDYGLIITGALSEENITNTYQAKEAAVTAVLAGNDMLYLPANFKEAYQAVLDAANEGEISENRIHNAVGRILTKKAELPEASQQEGEQPAEQGAE